MNIILRKINVSTVTKGFVLHYHSSKRTLCSKEQKHIYNLQFFSFFPQRTVLTKTMLQCCLDKSSCTYSFSFNIQRTRQHSCTLTVVQTFRHYLRLVRKVKHKTSVGADIWDKHRKTNWLAVLFLLWAQERLILSVRSDGSRLLLGRSTIAQRVFIFAAGLVLVSRKGPRQGGKILRCVLKLAVHLRRLQSMQS